MKHSPSFTPCRSAWLWGHDGRWRVGVTALAVSSLACVAAAAFWFEEQRAQQVRDAKRMQPVAVPPRVAAAPPLRPQERQGFNRVVRRLNVPWAAIFEALEDGALVEVALVSLETDAERGAVRIVTEGEEIDALLAHAERVQGSPRFVRSQLLRVEPPDGNATALTRLNFELALAR